MAQEKKHQGTWGLRGRDKFCIDCKFMGSAAIGRICRRHPPVGKTGWPTVATDDWCGEFEQSLQAKKEQDEIDAEKDQPVTP